MAVDTVSGNAVQTGGDGGGGIFNGSSLLLSSSTIAANTAPVGGGGIFSGGGATTTVAGTIVAGSRSGDCSGTVTDAGYNLSDDGTCGFTAGQNSLPETDPDLGPLADNGGTTETQAPGPTSPALDRIPLDTFVDGVILCPGTDQRGVARPQAVGCDIGSVEPVLPAAITSADRATATVGSPFSFTVTTSGTPAPKLSMTGTLPKGISLRQPVPHRPHLRHRRQQGHRRVQHHHHRHLQEPVLDPDRHPGLHPHRRQRMRAGVQATSMTATTAGSEIPAALKVTVTEY